MPKKSWDPKTLGSTPRKKNLDHGRIIPLEKKVILKRKRGKFLSLFSALSSGDKEIFRPDFLKSKESQKKGQFFSEIFSTLTFEDKKVSQYQVHIKSLEIQDPFQKSFRLLLKNFLSQKCIFFQQ